MCPRYRDTKLRISSSDDSSNIGGTAFRPHKPSHAIKPKLMVGIIFPTTFYQSISKQREYIRVWFLIYCMIYCSITAILSWSQLLVNYYWYCSYLQYISKALNTILDGEPCGFSYSNANKNQKHFLLKSDNRHPTSRVIKHVSAKRNLRSFHSSQFRSRDKSNIFTKSRKHSWSSRKKSQGSKWEKNIYYY